MHTRYIVSTRGFYGFFGVGETEELARKNLRKAAKKNVGVKNTIVHTFKSELPFAPSTREATENEADAWLGQDGSLNWIRCERV